MATAKDFSKLGEIDGVSKFILVRNDGNIVSKNFDDTASLSSTIIAVGKMCDSFSDDLNNRRYIHLNIERNSGENILVFSLGHYYLGIIKNSASDWVLLCDSILNFLKLLRKR